MAKKNGEPTRVEKALSKFVNQLVERMNDAATNGNWNKPWIVGTGYFVGLPQNIKGNVYMGGQALLLQLHTLENGYKMPVYLTAKQAREMGAHINKGAKSTDVFKWGVTYYEKETHKRISEKEYRALSEEDRENYEVRYYLKSFIEFNIDQTNFKEVHPDRYDALLNKFQVGKAERSLDTTGMYVNPAMDKLIHEDGAWICPIHEHTGGRAFYSITDNDINVPSKESFNMHPGDAEETYKDGQAYYGVILHEMAHSTGEENHLARPGIVNFQGFGSKSYSKEELVAELTSATVSYAMGFDKRLTENSAAYLKGWASNLKNDSRYIVSVMADVNKATQIELEHIDAQRKALGLKAILEGNLDGVEEKELNEVQKEETARSLEIDKKGTELSEGNTNDVEYYYAALDSVLPELADDFNKARATGDTTKLLNEGKAWLRYSNAPQQWMIMTRDEFSKQIIAEDDKLAITFSENSGIYDIMPKFTKAEILADINKNGLDNDASNVVKGIAYEDIARQFKEKKAEHTLNMPNGENLSLQYDSTTNKIEVRSSTGEEGTVRHEFDYDTGQTLDDNLQIVREELFKMTEYQAKENMGLSEEQKNNVRAFDSEYLDIPTSHPADQLSAAVVEIREDHPEHPLGRVRTVGKLREYFRGRDTSVAHWVEEASDRELVEEAKVEYLPSIHFRHNEGRTLQSLLSAHWRVNIDDAYRDYYMSLGEGGLRQYEHRRDMFNEVYRRYSERIESLAKYAKGLENGEPNVWVPREVYLSQESMEDIETGKDRVYYSNLMKTSDLGDSIDEEEMKAILNLGDRDVLFKAVLSNKYSAHAAWNLSHLVGTNPAAHKQVIGENDRYVFTYDESLTHPFELFEKVSDAEVRARLKEVGFEGADSVIAQSVARDMVQEEFRAFGDNTVELNNGEVLTIHYDHDIKKLVAGAFTEAGYVPRFERDYDLTNSLVGNMYDFTAELANMPEFQGELKSQEGKKAETFFSFISHMPQSDAMKVKELSETGDQEGILSLVSNYVHSDNLVDQQNTFRELSHLDNTLHVVAENENNVVVHDSERGEYSVYNKVSAAQILDDINRNGLDDIATAEVKGVFYGSVADYFAKLPYTQEPMPDGTVLHYAYDPDTNQVNFSERPEEGREKVVATFDFDVHEDVTTNLLRCFRDLSSRPEYAEAKAVVEETGKGLAENKNSHESEVVNPRDEKKYYVSYAFMQTQEDTESFEKLRNEGKYNEMLSLAGEYDQEQDIDLGYVHDRARFYNGDDLVTEDDDYAIVYNGSVGGTYDLLRKVSENDIREIIDAFGGLAPDHRPPYPECVKEIKRNMVEDEWKDASNDSTVQTDSGKVLSLSYDRENDQILVRDPENESLGVIATAPYDYMQNVGTNFGFVYEDMCLRYPEQQAQHVPLTEEQRADILRDIVSFGVDDQEHPLHDVSDMRKFKEVFASTSASSTILYRKYVSNFALQQLNHDDWLAVRAMVASATQEQLLAAGVSNLPNYHYPHREGRTFNSLVQQLKRIEAMAAADPGNAQLQRRLGQAESIYNVYRERIFDGMSELESLRFASPTNTVVIPRSQYSEGIRSMSARDMFLDNHSERFLLHLPEGTVKHVIYDKEKDVYEIGHLDGSHFVAEDAYPVRDSMDERLDIYRAIMGIKFNDNPKTMDDWRMKVPDNEIVYDDGTKAKVKYDLTSDAIEVTSMVGEFKDLDARIPYDHNMSVEDNLRVLLGELEYNGYEVKSFPYNLNLEKQKENVNMKENQKHLDFAGKMDLHAILKGASEDTDNPLYKVSGMREFKEVFASMPPSRLRSLAYPNNPEITGLKQQVAAASLGDLLDAGVSLLPNFHYPHRETRSLASMDNGLRRIETLGAERDDSLAQERVRQARRIYSTYKENVERDIEPSEFYFNHYYETHEFPRSFYAGGIRSQELRSEFMANNGESFSLYLPGGEVKEVHYDIDKDMYDIGHFKDDIFVVEKSCPIKSYRDIQEDEVYRFLTGIERNKDMNVASDIKLALPKENVVFENGSRESLSYSEDYDRLSVTVTDSGLGGFRDYINLPYDHGKSMDDNLKLLAAVLEFRGYKIQSFPLTDNKTIDLNEVRQQENRKISEDIAKIFPSFSRTTDQGNKILMNDGKSYTLDSLPKTAEVRDELVTACLRRMDLMVKGMQVAEKEGYEDKKIVKLAVFNHFADLFFEVVPDTAATRVIKNFEREKDNNHRVSEELATYISVKYYHLDEKENPRKALVESIYDGVIMSIKEEQKSLLDQGKDFNSVEMRELDDKLHARGLQVLGEYAKAREFLGKPFLINVVHEDGDLDTNVAAEAKKIMAAGISAPRAEKIAKEDFDDQKHAEMHEQEAEQAQEEKKQQEQQKEQEEAKKQQASEQKKKPTVAATHAALVLGALLASKEKDGIWLNHGFRKDASFLLSNTPVTPYNALMMNLNAEEKGYRSNIYTTYRLAKDNEMPVMKDEASLPLKWTKWTYVNNTDSTKVLTPKQFHALSKDRQRDYSARASKEVIRAFNIDQTVLPSKAHEAYVGLVKESGEQQELLNLNNETRVYSQYAQVTREHPDTVVILSDGDTYKTYKSSAKKLAQALELPLSKAEYDGKDVDYVEFPKRRIDFYVPRLQEAGHRVAVCEGEQGARLFKQNVDEDKVERDLQKMAKTMAKTEGFKYDRVMEFVQTHYDQRSNTLVYSGMGIEGVSKKKGFITKANDVSRAIVDVTGTRGRLDRAGRNNMTPFDDEKYEKLVQELTTGVVMARMGLPAKLSKENMELIPFWETELQENPKIMGMIERDVNNSVEVMEKWLRGEKPDYTKMLGTAPEKVELSKRDFTVVQKLGGLTSLDGKEIVVVRGKDSQDADVILPKGASLKEGTEVSGMRKDRITVALRKEGVERVHFYNAGGRWGLRQPNDYFNGKEASVVKLNQFTLETHQKVDFKELGVKEKVVVEDFKVLKNDDGKYFFHIKPVGEKSFDIIPEKKYINSFFEALKTRNAKVIGDMRKNLSMKFAELVSEHPDLRADYVTPKPSTDIDMNRITKANITSSKEDSSVKIVTAVIDGKYHTATITKAQWLRLWETDNMSNFKRCMAAVAFESELKQGRDSGQSEQQGEAKDAKESVTSSKGEVPINDAEQPEATVEEPEEQQARTVSRGM